MTAYGHGTLRHGSYADDIMAFRLLYYAYGHVAAPLPRLFVIALVLRLVHHRGWPHEEAIRQTWTQLTVSCPRSLSFICPKQTDKLHTHL